MVDRSLDNPDIKSAEIIFSFFRVNAAVGEYKMPMPLLVLGLPWDLIVMFEAFGFTQEHTLHCRKTISATFGRDPLILILFSVTLGSVDSY
jgi:hypothetical protein